MTKYTIQYLLLCICLILGQTSTVQAFQTITIRSAITTTQSTSPSALRMSGDKEEEIAKLEEQLKKLKAEASQEVVDGAVPDAASSSEAEEVVPEAMFLSEGWKEVEEEEESSGGGLKNVLAAIGVAVFLAVFSQIPVGQEDYSKYSAVKASTEKIDLGDLNRARQSGDL